MITLVPHWAHHYEEFWDAIRRRNLWFIKLRYAAVAVLSVFYLFSNYLLNFKFNEEQAVYIVSITACILGYNLLFHKVRKHLKSIPGQFNVMHFSLLQITADLAALTLLIYYTGGIESPLAILYIFHLVIGSLILPGRIVYTTAVQIILLYSVLVFLEYFGEIEHFALGGLFETPVYQNLKYISITLTIFAFTLVTIVYITNGIAKQLYKSEERLLDSLDKIREAEAEKQRYIMAVTHEIKTPIAAVSSYLNIVLKKFLGPINEQIEERLQRALNRSHEAVELINDVLNISKVRLIDDLEKKEIAVFDQIDKLIEKYTPTIESKKIILEYRFNLKESKKVKGDPFLIDVVLSNLMSNAVKYVDEKGRILISVISEGDKVKIRISDNGPGIPEKEQKKLFSDFFRASNIRKASEGTGLGLSIVKQIVEKHGGSVSLKSPGNLATEEKPGTTVEVSFPAVDTGNLA